MSLRSPTWLRTGLAVLIVSSAAAAYVVYTRYNAQLPRVAKGALHRSNAVHRSHGAGQRIRLDSTTATREAPLGVLGVYSGEVSVRIPIGLSPLPSMESLRGQLGPLPTSLRRDIELTALGLVFLACFAAHELELRQRLADLSLRGLPDALQSGNGNSDALASEIADVLPEISRDSVVVEINAVLESVRQSGHLGNWFSSRFGREPSGNSHSEGAGMEIADPRDSEDDPEKPSQSLKALLYNIAEEEARRKAYEHRGTGCDGCSERPIKGIRYRCLHCLDYDLCETCEAQNFHYKSHVFAKIRIPLPMLSTPPRKSPNWYSTCNQRFYHTLDDKEKKALALDSGFEETRIEALLDQFNCIASPFKSDEGLTFAIDRATFQKALTSDRWPHRLALNAMYDRMFDFYNVHHDGAIKFREFVLGIAYLRGPKSFEDLSRALKGFDFDNDGFVDRDDFLRMWRAKFEFHRRIVMETVEAQEAERANDALDVVHRSQPISAAFNTEEIPPAQLRRPGGKTGNAFGDMVPLPGTRLVLSDDDLDAGPVPNGRTEVNLSNGSVAADSGLRHSIPCSAESLNSPDDGASAMDFRIPAVPDLNNNGNTSGRSPDAHLNIGSPALSRTSIISRLSEDVLWQVAEDGWHEVLDPIFRAAESRDREVAETREERWRWRAEIEETMKERQEFEEMLRANPSGDPLMATAAQSLPTASERQPRAQGSVMDISSDFLPTDTVDVTLQEEAVGRGSLDGLLQATGYGIRNMATDGASVSASLGARGDEAEDSSGSQTHPVDPTMPQHKPNAVSAESGSQSRKTIPSRDRLEYLGVLSVIDKRIMQVRGGPGRMSYHEIEDAVARDESGELRGHITSWLEWACF